VIDLEKKEDNSKLGKNLTVSININLLGYQVREEIEKSISGTKISKGIILSILFIFISLVSLSVGYIVLTSLRDDEVARKQDLERRKAELEQKDKLLTERLAVKTNFEKKRDILAWASGTNLKWSSLLEEIRNRIPSNLWVDKIDINDGKVTISGETFDHKTVAIFLANIQDSSMFNNVVLDYTKKTSEIKVRDLEKVDSERVKINLANDREFSSTTKFNIRFEINMN
jgi:Tfp pilus assembly protein PilN